MPAPEASPTGLADLREVVARLLVPYYYGGFENQERHEPDDTGFRKWKNPPGTPNARAYELTDAILAAMGTFHVAQRQLEPPRADEDHVKSLILKHCTVNQKKVLLRTSWKDGIDIDRPSSCIMNIADDLLAAAPQPASNAYASPLQDAYDVATARIKELEAKLCDDGSKALPVRPETCVPGSPPGGSGADNPTTPSLPSTQEKTP